MSDPSDGAAPILFLVPARGGSKRVPGKNLRLVGGMPLVARAIRTGLAAAAALGGSDAGHRVLCSTDDEAIAEVAAAWGGEVLRRPAGLATDTATSVAVALHALDAADAEAAAAGRPPFGTLVLLQPTSPLTEAGDVIDAVARHWAAGGCSVTSVAPSHPATWHQVLGEDGSLSPATGAATGDLLLAGAFYVVTAAELRESGRLVQPGRTLGVTVPAERGIDIDTEMDLLLARTLVSSRADEPTGSRRVEPGDGGDVRVVTVLSTGRQDWGILHSTCEAIRSHPGLELDLVIGGMHLSPRHGMTVDLVREDGFEPDALAGWLPVDSSEADPAAAVQSASALTSVARHLARRQPDAIVLAGDRFETLAAAIAATLASVPIVHLHGGEQTLGAFDDAMRHAITKLAHLHLVSNEEHAARVMAMGEDPSAVRIVGTPGLDAVTRRDLPDREEIAAYLGLPLEPPVVIVTVHPTTLDADPASAARAVAAAMRSVPATYVVTLPNVDPGAVEVAAIMSTAAAACGGVAVRAMGERRYWGLLRIADAMLGNSSSGIAEAPAAGLPVVNVGDRQAGRHRPGRVEDVPADPTATAAALRSVLARAYRPAMPEPDFAVPPGLAGARVADIIAAWDPPRPPRKAPIEVTHFAAPRGDR